jgi:hypothetical protein
MAVQQLFYRNAVPVSTAAHRDLCIRSQGGYGFAASVNSVPLTAVEFALAAAHYPIIFAGNGEAVFPAAVLGLQPGQNMMLDEAGRWTGGYVPAFIRRYPFVLGQDEGGTQFTLLVDESFEGCNREGKGERLFDADGNQSQFLRSALAFLQDYQARFQRTQAFCARLVASNLLQPMQMQFNLGDQARTLGGFMTIDRERLKTLPADTLADMVVKDELECCYLHLSSMRHFQAMVDRARPAGAPAASGASAA